ncbi:dihydrofolate reductase family protein [Streptomyces spectabilis]|uniref:Dihydrofolate reductase n=1 Tax=Streptomyces spectabilis TaxID=68270 RepID=A0A516R662_STRST|nr:dihydrofolate reductase family protein [Streptomyces spectabilis]QDQ11156.1 dihydrofolate reductase [Streptomyces spectabilis]
MSEVVVLMHVSLDGAVADPSWGRPFRYDGHEKYQLGQVAASRALLLGRVTFQEMAAAWPRRDATEEYTGLVDAMPKYVVSTTLEHVAWNGVLIPGQTAEHIAKLRGEPGQDLLVLGGAELVGHLLRLRLVDVLKLCVHPEIAGTGRRLFPESGAPGTWTLTGTSVFASGAVVLEYRAQAPAPVPTVPRHARATPANPPPHP